VLTSVAEKVCVTFALLVIGQITVELIVYDFTITFANPGNKIGTVAYELRLAFSWRKLRDFFAPISVETASKEVYAGQASGEKSHLLLDVKSS